MECNVSYKYFTVLTDIGKQKLAEAITTETPLDFTEMAIGDSNGLSYNPTSDMTALKHEVYRAAISSMKINTDDANIMEFEFVVPSTSGGYYVREAGLFASDGSLIAISRLPEQYKAEMAEGAGSSMTVRILVAISSEAQLYINVPESINYATQTYVAEEFEKHKAEENPHTGYVLVETYSEKITELENSLASKAESNHNHDGTYLTKTDASSTYATKSEMNTGLTGKAASNHTHTGYAASNHTHTGYAASNHSHDDLYVKKTETSSVEVRSLLEYGYVSIVGEGNDECITPALSWCYDSTNKRFIINMRDSDTDARCSLIINSNGGVSAKFAQ